MDAASITAQPTRSHIPIRVARNTANDTSVAISARGSLGTWSTAGLPSGYIIFV
jgi:hypothetical protein